MAAAVQPFVGLQFMARLVNRAALVVRPRQPYLDWAASLDPAGPSDSKSLKTHVSVYLVAEDPKGQEETAPIKDYYEYIFASELQNWWTDERKWPAERSLKQFHEWFDVVGQSVIEDLESNRLKAEEE